MANFRDFFRTRRTIIFIAAVFFLSSAAASFYFSQHYRIAVDTQLVPCIDARMLLIEIDNKTPKVGELFAFSAPESAEPVYQRGTLMAKWIVAGPGDIVRITSGEKILVNGHQVAHGMPHLSMLSPKERERFYGMRRLGADEWWMMGEAQTSFDSRYWGPIKTHQFIGRAHVIY